ncbi:hypothetical protein CTI12_AA082720 [Artemisia annua]|nr:hypothetical protein CTI12_AA082720 [Artemisia annua]
MGDRDWTEVSRKKKDFIIGSQRSKEDEVQKLSTSVFVTNFPDQFYAKDLWNTCKQYGNVVDAYIPNRRSKAGKRFGFVRFIKIFDVKRLVKNLCTVWVGRHKLHANVARFLREPLTKKSNQFNTEGENRHSAGDDFIYRGVKGNSSSYAHIVKGSHSLNTEMENKPALVLDNSCLNQHDYSNFLMGKVKDFASLSNLKVVLGNEGFDNIELKYMGGYWIMIEFQSVETKQMFQSNVGIGTWFSQLKQASTDFIVDGRVTWVEIEGIPLKIWSENTFHRIASIWGTLLHVEDQEDGCFNRKRICINTNVNSNIFESFKVIYQGKVSWVRAKEIPGWVPDFVEENDEESDIEDEINGEEVNGEDVGFKKVSTSEGDNDKEVVPETIFEDELHKVNIEEECVGQNEVNSEDPFNLYELIYKKKDENNKGDCVEDSLKFPPGFTPNDVNQVIEERINMSNESKRASGEGVHSVQEEDNVSGVKKHG